MKGVKLTGILYLHRIIDNRMGGVAFSNIKLFRLLCGDQAMRNVTLCTTMWDKVPLEEAEAREGQLKGDFWNMMLESGAAMARHDNTPQSARDVIQRFLNLKEIDLDLQLELSKGASLADTTAGREINKEVLQAQAKAQSDLLAAKLELEAAVREKDEFAQKIIKEQQQALEKQLKQAKEDAEGLARSRAQELDRLQKMFESEQEKWSAAMEKQRVEHEASIKRVRDENHGHGSGCVIF